MLTIILNHLCSFCAESPSLLVVFEILAEEELMVVMGGAVVVVVVAKMMLAVSSLIARANKTHYNTTCIYLVPLHLKIAMGRRPATVHLQAEEAM